MGYLLLFFIFIISLLQATAQTVELTGKHGSIRTPGYPQPYPDNVNRSWRIRVRPGHKVRLHFTVFDLEDSYEDDVGACAYDYVQIEGYRRLCGNPQNFPTDSPRIGHIFTSTGNEMVITFVSDYSNEEPKPLGFEAHWAEEDVDECYDLRSAVNSAREDWDELIYCNHFCHNVPGSYYCSCRPGFTLDANQHTCVAVCVNEIAADPEVGFLVSPDYPKPYGKLSDCTTTLRAAVGMAFDVRFDEEFGIEDHYEEGCVYDWVQLTDDSGNVRRYCGETTPNNGSWIDMNTKALSILFHSDLSVEKIGYKMYYRIYPVKCLVVLHTPSNGSITSTRKDVYEYNDRVQFACDRGFRMVGSSESICTAEGTWSTRSPVCQIKYCPRPDHLLNLTRTMPPAFNEEERPYGSTIHIPCINNWYKLASGSADWICDDDEVWKPVGRATAPEVNIPVCRPECGKKNAIVKDVFVGFILGGRHAREGEWPWMAFIDLGEGLRGSSFCGGSLVDEQYVVTAGHCVNRYDAQSLVVYLGVTDRANNSNPHIQVFNAIENNVHPGFVNPSDLNSLLDNDIAVLKLNRSAVIGQHVRPICIPRSRVERGLPESSPSRGIVAGWGVTETGLPSEILKLVRVPYVNHTQCVAVYREQSGHTAAYSQVQITQNHFCAGFVNRAKDSCEGDSGGPLMWRNNNREWFLNGIVSFGTGLGTCEFFVLGVYTKVANYIEFLDNNIILPD